MVTPDSDFSTSNLTLTHRGDDSCSIYCESQVTCPGESPDTNTWYATAVCAKDDIFM